MGGTAIAGGASAEGASASATVAARGTRSAIWGGERAREKRQVSPAEGPGTEPAER